VLNGNWFTCFELCYVKPVAKVRNQFVNWFCYRHSKPLTALTVDACNTMSDAVIKVGLLGECDSWAELLHANGEYQIACCESGR